ncbi:Trypsin-like peptidase domain-containing protein [Filimonas lacunae]|uniref:Trypsin-like peptidase domain-containing protein n=1 Tax=Filimonas lacunae TaxID=477680 RepID=A0A173MLY2_9BACT|nr:serine protease [Filimonas lacunae]BAV08479.1 serine protease [Filimonas lacunae]SIT33998.1 Trypsin-like peptidase domain-containing protein [Filimonas lacunae]
MEDIQLIEATERYLNGTMSEVEKAEFEQLRKNTPEIDQMVVEHKLFLHQMDAYAEHRDLKQSLHDAHTRLVEKGAINENSTPVQKGKVIQFWHKYRRVTGIAASIAGVTALAISWMVTAFSPNNNKSELKLLIREINQIKRNQQQQDSKINEVESKLPKGVTLKGGGSAFLLDSKGYLLTNAHVIKDAKGLLVVNKGKEYSASIIYVDAAQDLAVLKINDSDFTTAARLPYGIRKNSSELGEEVFTLGYPRNDIVYNMGYLSSRTGYEGDTNRYQISLPANPGNSGGPVFNKNGEIIGVLSSRQTQTEGAVFAIKSKGIYQMLDEMKKADTTAKRIKLPVNSNLKGVERKQQIAEIEDCVFLVNVYN